MHSIAVNGQRYSDRLPTVINIIYYYYYCLGLGAQLPIMCNYYSTFIIVLQSLRSLYTAAFIGEDWRLKHNDDCVCLSSD